MSSEDIYVTYSSYFVDLSVATLSFKLICLQFLRSFGQWGNLIFFICSAWFLLDSKKVSLKKWFQILLEVWVISILFTLVTMFVFNKRLPLNLLMKSLLPTTFGNNWYLTCYLMFYPVHTLLNRVLDSVSQKNYFRLAIAGFIIFFIADFVKSTLFFPSRLLLWIGVYIIVGYMKKYMHRYTDNIRANLVVFLVSVGLFLALQIVWNIAGTRFTKMETQMLRWDTNNNPFWLISSLCMLNIARNMKFKSSIVNYISGFSMLIYLIHENLLLRTYLRPYLLEYVHNVYGYEHIYLIVLVFTVVTFVASFICAIIYRNTLGRVVRAVGNSLQSLFQKRYVTVEDKLIETLN